MDAKLVPCNLIQAPRDKSENVTLRDIAREAGVSLATVSRALRDDPVTAQATRDKVMEAAAKLNYRPDPALQVLIERRWRGRRSNEGLNVSYIFDSHDLTDTHEIEYKRYRAASEALGYTLIPEDLRDYPNVLKLIQRIEAKGVSGLVLSYISDAPYDISELLNRFAAVSITVSRLQPDCPIVMHAEFQAIENVWRRLTDMGYRRIGVLFEDYPESFTMDQRLGAVYCRQHHQTRGKSRIPIQFCKIGDDAANDKVGKWVERYQPDVVLGDTHHHYETLVSLGYSIPGDLAFVSVNMWDAEHIGEIAGYFRDNVILLRRALQLLNLMLRSGRRGVHQSDLVEIVSGEWKDGASLPVVK
ncbi:MAG: LacI family DNA-binding transcriptional regulator [Puniceicoccales bacterium]